MAAGMLTRGLVLIVRVKERKWRVLRDSRICAWRGLMWPMMLMCAVRDRCCRSCHVSRDDLCVRAYVRAEVRVCAGGRETHLSN